MPISIPTRGWMKFQFVAAGAIYLSIYLPIYQSIYLPAFSILFYPILSYFILFYPILSYLSILSYLIWSYLIYLSIFLSFDLSIFLSFYLSIFLSFHISDFLIHPRFIVFYWHQMFGGFLTWNPQNSRYQWGISTKTV